MAVTRLVLVAVVAATLCAIEGRPQAGDERSETLPFRTFSQSDRRHGKEVIQQSYNQPIQPFSQADDPQGHPVRVSTEREVSPEKLPVRPFDQYDSRGSSSSGRVAPTISSQPVRPFSMLESTGASGDQRSRQTSRREEDPFQSRAHATPLNPRITLQSEKDRQQHRTHHVHSSVSASQRKDETPNWSTGQVRLEPKQGQSSHSMGQKSSSTPLQRDNRRTSPPDQTNKGGFRSQQQHHGGSSLRMGSVEAAAAEQGKSEPAVEEGIIFPGPTKEGSGGKLTERFTPPQLGSVEPNCAKGSTFCENADSYPSEYLKSILSNEGNSLKEFFGNDLLLNDTSISQRIDSVDENPLCQSVEQVVYPKAAQNKEDKWLYVVNQDQYIQGVRVEKCLKPESECLLTKSFPLGYKTVCRQKYIYRRMLALNGDGKTFTDTFRLPSCCSCFVKTVSDSERKR